jgi:hypothetical protein
MKVSGEPLQDRGNSSDSESSTPVVVHINTSTDKISPVVPAPLTGSLTTISEPFHDQAKIPKSGSSTPPVVPAINTQADKSTIGVPASSTGYNAKESAVS